MTQTTLGNFVLESRHLFDGLSAEDIEAYTGVPSALFYLSDFPHWPEYFETGQLAPRALQERYRAMKNAIEPTVAAHFAQWQDNTPTKDLFKITDMLQSPQIITFHAEALPPATCEITNLTSQWLAPNRNVALPHTEVLGRTVAFVPVGTYDADEIEPKNEGDYWSLSLSNTALMPHFFEPAERYWRFMLYLPKTFIQRYPDTALSHLLISLHELRHTPQAYPPFPTLAYRLSKELDADIFSLNTLAENGLAEEVRYIYPKARYMNFLFGKEDRYLYAPALEAYLSRRSPPPIREILQARDAFHERIFELSGHKRDQRGALTEDEKKRAAFWIAQSFINKPEFGYPLLNQWVEEKAFADKPLVNQIAQGIIGAIQFFSPRLLTKRAYTLRFSSKENDLH